MSEKINDQKLIEKMIYDDAEGFSVKDEISNGNSRWHIEKTTIVQRLSDGKLFMINWRKGATEYQDDDISTSAIECEAYKEVVTKYRAI